MYHDGVLLEVDHPRHDDGAQVRRDELDVCWVVVDGDQPLCYVVLHYD